MSRLATLLLAFLLLCSCTSRNSSPVSSQAQALTDCTIVADGTPCDDGNACTYSGACKAGRCEKAPNMPTGAACDDGNPCTTSDSCQNGWCQGAAVADGSACVADSKCQVNATCQSGYCQGAYKQCDMDPCLMTSCNAATGQCETMWTATDGSPCLSGAQCKVGGSGACLAGHCNEVNSTDGSTCDDSDQCTSPDKCAAGACVGTTANGVACNDFDPCTRTDTCQAGKCAGTVIAEGGACDDGNTCTSGEVCRSGSCAGAAVADGASCPKTDLCTESAVCQGGWCFETRRNCPGDPCSNSTCNPATGQCAAYWTATDGTQCNSWGPCVVENSGLCQAGRCLETSKADGTACDDGVFCTGPDKCAAGKCVGTSAAGRACDDGDPCTRTDTCQVDRCAGVQVADGTACDDGSPCTTGDTCNGGLCGASSVANGTPCQTADKCQESPTCQFGQCMGTHRQCSSDYCAMWACNPSSGQCEVVGSPMPDGTTCFGFSECKVSGSGLCQAGLCLETNKANGATCDDDKACTSGDRCQDGACTGTPVDCSNLSEPCNLGTCNSTTGFCEWTPRQPGTSCGSCLACNGLGDCTAGAADWQPCTGGYCQGGSCSPLPDGGFPWSDASGPWHGDGGMPWYDDGGMPLFPDGGAAPFDASTARPDGGTVRRDAQVLGEDTGEFVPDDGGVPSDSDASALLDDGGNLVRVDGSTAPGDSGSSGAADAGTPVAPAGCGCQSTSAAGAAPWALVALAGAALRGRRRD